jgi:hypothetical protein
MRQMTAAWLVSAAMLWPAAAGAGPTAQDRSPLASAERLTCSFVFYTTTRWVEGVPEVRTGDDQFEFDIARINHRAHTAEVITDTATARVSAFLTDTGLNVIEQTPLGNFIVTTVFATGRTGDAFPAIHSRHLGDTSAPPSPSQYFGSCRVTQ